MSDATGTSVRAFGFTLAGVDLLLDPHDDAQYVADAVVYPLYLAPSAVLGLVQVRGQPVPVLDARPVPRGQGRRIGEVRVLVLAGGGDAGALLVEHPPQAVELRPESGDAAQPLAPDRGVSRPECAFADALRDSLADVEGRRWWRFDATALFRALAAG
ncbi:MAG: chemotaxis protein CheW [Burkholderiaceae bacterium]|nr:chemotaxis protein CheW [Burkholderiaceae bacterium]